MELINWNEPICQECGDTGLAPDWENGGWTSCHCKQEQETIADPDPWTGLYLTT